MASFTNKDGEPLAITMQITRSFSEGSGATWSTGIPQLATQEEMDDISDRMMKSLERQEIWARISNLNNEIEMHAKQRAQVEFSIVSLETRHGDFSKSNVDTKNAYNQSKEGLTRIDLLISALQGEQMRLRGGL